MLLLFGCFSGEWYHSLKDCFINKLRRSPGFLRFPTGPVGMFDAHLAPDLPGLKAMIFYIRSTLQPRWPTMRCCALNIWAKGNGKRDQKTATDFSPQNDPRLFQGNRLKFQGNLGWGNILYNWARSDATYRGVHHHWRNFVNFVTSNTLLKRSQRICTWKWMVGILSRFLLGPQKAYFQG